MIEQNLFELRHIVLYEPYFEMAKYKLDEIPEGTSWIKNLKKPEAIEQCREWQITPGETVEECRVSLRQFVVTHNQAGATSSDSNDDDRIEGKLVHDRQPTSVQGADLKGVEAKLVETNMSELLRGMHKITMDAVAQTARALASELNLGGKMDTREENTYLAPYIRDMIKELPKCQGLDTEHTLAFLTQISKIVELNVAPEKVIILNTLANTQHRLREFWLTMVSDNADWTQLLYCYAQTFFTPDSLRNTQSRFLYRHQRYNESLLDYVKDIQMKFKILSPKSNELEIFQTIFRGINSQTRNTFAGLRPILSLQDLIEIAPITASILHNTRYTEGHVQRGGTSNNSSNAPRFFGNRHGHIAQYRHFNPSPHRTYNNQQSRAPPFRPTQFSLHRPSYQEHSQQRLGYTPGWTDNSRHANIRALSNRGNLNGNRGR